MIWINPAAQTDPDLLRALRADQWMVHLCKPCQAGKPNKKCARYPKCKKCRQN